MFSFMWPWMILFLPIIWVVRWWLKPAQREPQTEGAIRVPFWDRLSVAPVVQEVGKNNGLKFLYILMWSFFIVALMRPVWWGQAIPISQKSYNIMLALDVSGSMGEMDFDLENRPVSRLEMLKSLSNDFILSRKGDHLGLVIFGSQAYTYAPLSPDISTLCTLIGEIGIGIAGTQTAIGEALALAVQGVSSVPNTSQIVILMSDGHSNAGQVSVEEALQLAIKQGIKIYTVGIGSDAQMMQDFFGMVQINTHQDLDEKTLQDIATQTQGRYFRAKSTQDLKEIYNTINQMEPVIQDTQWFRPRTELFFIPLLCVMFLLLLTERYKR